MGAGSSVKDDLVEASPGELRSLLRALQESDQSQGAHTRDDSPREVDALSVAPLAINLR